MSYELEETDYYVNMNRVVEMYLKGEDNATKIARALSLPRKDVLNYIDTWRDIAKSNDRIKDRAAEALTAMDRHYSMIIKEYWTIIDDRTIDLKTKAGALKNVADIEATRQATLQKAGLYDDAGISEELVAMEEYTEKIKGVLLEVVKKFPETKLFIMEKFSAIGKPVAVDAETVPGEVIE